MIEIDSWARSEAPLPSHIKFFRRKNEMRVLNRYEIIIYSFQLTACVLASIKRL